MARRRWGYESRGTPGLIALPGCLLFLAVASLPILVPDLMQRCIGRTIETPRGKGGLVVMAVEAACSPLLFFGAGREIALGLTLVVLGLACAWAWRWSKRHQAYWDTIREKERARRAEKRALKAAATEQEEPPAGRD